MTTTSSNSVDFSDLTPEDQAAVAQRLLAIKNSRWKPFWCRNTTCAGDPHPVLGPLGEPTFVDDNAVAGPNGEPVAAVYEDSRTGLSRTVLDERRVSSTETFVGRVVIDRQWAHNHARADQRLPVWKKAWTLMSLSGRGTGKTRFGVEFVTLHARRGLDGAIIGRRGDELINTHVKEILKFAHPEFMPTHRPGKNLLEWPEVTMPDGSTRTPITYLFSAERPENIRSVNLNYYWMDEAAFMDEVATAYMNAELATRADDEANPIHVLITSTPVGSKWVIEREDDPDIIVRRVATYANRANLSPDYIAKLEKNFEGTRMGRQEIYGEVLRDVPGALWNDSMFTQVRCEDASEFAAFVDTMDDVIVAVDPAGSANKRSDETGIIAVGVQRNDDAGERLNVEQYFVLADGTIKGTTSEWAAQVYKVARLVGASRIIAEKNFGGDMVKQVMADHAELNPNASRNDFGEEFKIEVVHASEGKETRAEGTVNKYEQARVTHVSSPGVFGDLSALEKEQVTWVPRNRGGKTPSPNRIDATVWGIRTLESGEIYDMTMATSRDVLSKIKRPPALPPGHNLSGVVGPAGRSAYGGVNFRGVKTRPGS